MGAIATRTIKAHLWRLNETRLAGGFDDRSEATLVSPWNDFLGSGNSLLELGLTFAGLFGGSVVGTRSAALGRMKADDRRVLVDETVAKVAATLLHMPAQHQRYDPDFKVGLDDRSRILDREFGPDLREYWYALEWANDASRVLGEVGRIVDRLSWTERQIWKHVVCNLELEAAAERFQEWNTLENLASSAISIDEEAFVKSLKELSDTVMAHAEPSGRPEAEPDAYGGPEWPNYQRRVELARLAETSNLHLMGRRTSQWRLTKAFWNELRRLSR